MSCLGVVRMWSCDQVPVITGSRRKRIHDGRESSRVETRVSLFTAPGVSGPRKGWR